MPNARLSLEPVADDPVLCEHAGRCGGCPLIDRPYPEQLAAKRERVLQAVRRYPALAGVEVEATAGARPVVGYRTRAKLVVGAAEGGEPAALGLYAKGGGHRVVDAPGCRVLAPPLARVAAWLRARLRDGRDAGTAMAPYGASGAGGLRAVDLREVDAGGGGARVLATFVVQRDRAGDAAPLKAAAEELLRACPEAAGVAVSFHEGDAPQILGGETVVLAGAASAPDRAGRSVHFATFGSFVQAHRGQAARVHDLLAEALLLPGRRARVLDLYGGSGAIALGLAAAGARAVLVESFGPAVEQAEAAARAQGLAVEAERADAARAIARMAARGERFDAVVVNPPRRGASPAAREGIARLGAPVVAYVSCDPDTLARDLDHLARLGYAPAPLRPVDMIPLTEEVETVAVLRRAPPPAPAVAYADDGALVVEKGPHEPAAPEAAYCASLLERARRLPGAEAAAVARGLDARASGLVVLARRPEHVEKWRRALAAPGAATSYLAAVRGVLPAKGAVTRPGRGGAPVRVRYRRLAIASGHSVLRVTAAGGDEGDVLRCFAAIGHPVLGDDRHGHAPTNRHFEERAGLDRAFLHCRGISVAHPDTGAAVSAVSALPGDLVGVMERMGGDAGLSRA